MNDVRYWIRKAKTFLWHSPEPITRTFIAVKVLFFFIYLLFLLGSGLDKYLTFDTHNALSYPWTFLTYPLLSIHPFELIFVSYWFWVVGSTLERSLTSRVYGKYVLSLVLIPSIALWLGSLLISLIDWGFLGSSHVTLISMFIPVAGLTVSWCLFNPERVVMFGFVLPIPGKIIMWITIAFVYFNIAWFQQAPWLGFFGLAHIAYAVAYTNKITRVSGTGPDYLYKEGPPNILDRIGDWFNFLWRKLKRTLLRK